MDCFLVRAKMLAFVRAMELRGPPNSSFPVATSQVRETLGVYLNTRVSETLLHDYSLFYPCRLTILSHPTLVKTARISLKLSQLGPAC